MEKTNSFSEDINHKNKGITGIKRWNALIINNEDCKGARG